LEADLKAAVAREDFESAASLRDAIKTTRQLSPAP
jgi:protein-arginine kinase activator protein McsA